MFPRVQPVALQAQVSAALRQTPGELAARVGMVNAQMLELRDAVNRSLELLRALINVRNYPECRALLFLLMLLSSFDSPAEVGFCFVRRANHWAMFSSRGCCPPEVFRSYGCGVWLCLRLF